MSAPSRSLLLHAYLSSTRSSYMSCWRASVAVCAYRTLVPLPADAVTTVGYIAYESEREALPPNSLGKYLSTISGIHAMAGCPDPTAAHVVALAVAGYKEVQAALVGYQSLKWLPTPADFIMQALCIGLRTAENKLSSRCGGLVWAYILFNRSGAASDMRYRDSHVTAAGVECQVPFCKGGVRRGAEWIATKVPYAAAPPGDESAICLLRHLLGDHVRHRRRPDERLFFPGYWQTAYSSWSACQIVSWRPAPQAPPLRETALHHGCRRRVRAPRLTA